MCGIIGYYSPGQAKLHKTFKANLRSATDALEHRGPDAAGFYEDKLVGLGHRRLSIIDLSAAGRQPLWNHTHRYAIIFNGEIYNYQLLRSELRDKGVAFETQTDTEVILQLYIHEGPQFVKKLNGFFAFAIYDVADGSLFMARDRFGIKPLYLYNDGESYAFASELGALLALGVPKELDYTALSLYLQFNYVPAPYSMIQSVSKVEPGTSLFVNKKGVKAVSYYSLDDDIALQLQETRELSYEAKKEKLRELVGQSVKDRLVADVPLGSFLSGGVDSSIVVAEASKHVSSLKTFSIGYADHDFFDETDYSQEVAKRFGTDHRVFKLSGKDFLSVVDQVLNHFSEPFADSSSLAVYILSEYTREDVTVALSGDGADEIFAGYEKYSGLYRSFHPGFFGTAAASLAPLWHILPKSRDNGVLNFFRKLDKYARSALLNPAHRALALARFASESAALNLLTPKISESVIRPQEFYDRFFSNFSRYGGVNGALRADIDLVLQNDMLTKVDMMSMAHGLEVRVPFLDYRLVSFAMSLPEKDKINKSMRKKILQDAYKDILPARLYNRPKKGFEVPLRHWLSDILFDRIENEWLSDEYIEKQKIFSVSSVRSLKDKLRSTNPGDAHIHVWNLIVFQAWWIKFMNI